MKLIYKRVLLKISGEIFNEGNKSIFKKNIIQSLLQDIYFLIKMGVEISIVVGGGNLFRGADLSKLGVNNITSDYIGILSTIINGLFLKDIFQKFNIPVCLMSSLYVDSVCNRYSLEESKHLLSKSVVVIFCGGMGTPCFTTDSAACLRAIETESEIILKGTKVNGVYSQDPNNFENVTLYSKLNYSDVLNNEYNVMDLTAFVLARNYKLPICIFNLNNHHALIKILSGEQEGTIINGD